MLPANLVKAVRAIEARPPRAGVFRGHRPLVFTLQFRGWRDGCGLADDVLARCMGITPTRLRRIYNYDLPEPGEVNAIAAAMDFPAPRLAELVAADRIARALTPEPACV